MRLIVRADASPAIGGGHIMRCLTLADALAEDGHETRFVCGEITESLTERIRVRGHGLDVIALGDGDLAQDAERTLEEIGSDRPDWLIVDHYRLDSRWEERVRGSVGAILAIDDLADRRHDCDLLLDQNYGRRSSDYRGLVPGECRILTGPLYALLRPEFARARELALDRQSSQGPVRDVFVAFGATDIGGITGRVLPPLLDALPESKFHVAVGRTAPSRDTLEAMARAEDRIRLYIDTDNLADPMSRCDIGIGAAGTMSWERCCLALPSIAVVLADNQRFVAERLEQAGAQATATSGDPAALADILQSLAGDRELRARMSAAAAAITDGKGARRIADAMTRKRAHSASPLLRDAKPGDRQRVWLWRNDPQTRSASQDHAPITWQNHCAWWERTFADRRRAMMIVEINGEPAALVRFDPGEGSNHEVGINLAPAIRGRGLGAPILAEAIDRFEAGRGPCALEAVIHKGNPGSRKIFERLGFRRIAPLGDDGFERYVRSEDDLARFESE